MNKNHKNYLKSIVSEYSKIIELEKDIFNAANICVKSVKKGGKIFFCGNGGSAADSQHLAAELVGKFLKLRKAIPAISLTSNSSILTAISNDVSFEAVFVRQLEALSSKKDVLYAISTSGKSKNINNAIKYALKKKLQVIYLTSTKCKLRKVKNLNIIKVAQKRVDRIQEQHLTIGHLICEFVENSC